MEYPSANKVFVMGRVEGDTHNSEKKVGFRVRTKRKWKVSTVVRVVAFGMTAQSLVGLSEGAIVGVDGRLDNRKFEHNGETKWVTEVVASDVQVFSGSPKPKVDSGGEDDLPF